MQCIVFGLNDALRLSLAAINRRTRDNRPQVAQPLLHHEPQGARQRPLTHSAGSTQLTVTDVRSTTVLNRLLLISCALCSVVACKPLGAGARFLLNWDQFGNRTLPGTMVSSNGKQDFEDANMSSVKEAARSIVDNLPEQATWDDLMYELYVKQKIEAGLEAAAEGRTVPHEEVKARLLARKSQ